MTPEQALTTPDHQGNRYYTDAELLSKFVADYLVIGRTRPLSDEEKRAIRSDAARFPLRKSPSWWGFLAPFLKSLDRVPTTGVNRN